MLREYGRVNGSVNQYVKVGQATKLLRSKLHKITAVKLQEAEYVARYGCVNGSVNQCVKVCQAIKFLSSKPHKITAVKTPGSRLCCDITVV